MPNTITMTATAIPTEPTPEPLQHAWYFYDGDGNMVKGIVNSTTTYYPGRHFNKEVTVTGTKVQKFYFAIGQTIAVRTILTVYTVYATPESTATLLQGYATETSTLESTPEFTPTETATPTETGAPANTPTPAATLLTTPIVTDTLQWILSDHLGSATTTANADGTWNSSIQYTAFGEIRLTKGITPTKYRYTGQLAQAEMGLDYYVARWYDPLTGHFTSADSIVPEPGKASGFDRYGYVSNNPIRYNDPSGHRPCDDEVNGRCVTRQDPFRRQAPPSNNRESNSSGHRDSSHSEQNGYLQGWSNFGKAWEISSSPNASLVDRYVSGNYMGYWGGAHVALAAGLAGIGCVVAGPGCVAAVEGALGIGAASNAGSINQFWSTTVDFLGNKVYQRQDIFEWSGENIQRMQRGLAPIGIDGRSIELHHLLQTMEGPLAEVTRTFHQTYSTILNSNPNTMGSVIDRVAFSSWRTDYWIQRVADYLSK